MQEDVWTNTKNNTEYGVTGPLGSPRAWLRRALDAQSLDDTTFQHGTITPYEISVAGIWYRQPDGYGLTVTGMHRELFRWFEIPQPDRMLRSSKKDLVPALGLCAAVPMHEVMHWLKTYTAHGAAYVWWKRPTNQSMRAATEGLRVRRQLDHAVVYELLETGKTTTEIGKLLGFPEPNIAYVAKKWRNGVPLIARKPHLDIDAIIAARESGMSVKDIATQFDTTPAYIYRKFGNIKCQDLNQP
jgi:hypothetical protein